MRSSIAKQLTIAGVFAVAGLSLAVGTAAAENTSGVPIPAQPRWAKGNPAKYGKQLVSYIDKADQGWVDSYAKSSITIINARGQKSRSKTRQLTLEGSGGNKSLIRYMSPANVRGVAALTHEHHRATDDSWLYLPSSRRVRRISGANRTSSFQGTEFTYEDMTRIVPSRYRWKFIKNMTHRGQPVFKVSAVPTYRNSGYSKQVFYLNRKQWRAETVEFYDKAGRLLKVLKFSKWKLYHGRYWRAHKLHMHNKQSQKKSIIRIGSQFLNIRLYKKNGKARKGLSSSSFTRRALEGR